MIAGRVLGKYHVDWDVETDAAIDPAWYGLEAEWFLHKVGYFAGLNLRALGDEAKSLLGYCRNGCVTILPVDDTHFKIIIRYDS